MTGQNQLARGMAPVPLDPYKFPANVDAERSILGACIEDGEILNAVVAEGLFVSDFSLSDHQIIWGAVLGMRARAVPVSLISLVEYCPKIDGPMLADLTRGVVLLRPHIVHYARIVKRKAKLRRLLHLSDWLSEESTAAGADPDSVVIELNRKISGLGAGE